MKREHYLDIAKGIAMILVIVGHVSGIPKPLYYWINSFHMPLFFILSGLVFNPLKYEFKEFFKKKNKTLLFPYFTLSFITFAFTYLIFERNSLFTRLMLKDFLGIFVVNRKRKIYFSLWFVVATYIAEIVLYFVIRLIDKKVEKKSSKNILMIITAFVFSIVGYLMNTYLKNGLVFNLDLAVVAISFIFFGYIIKENLDIVSKLFKLPYVILYGVMHYILATINFTKFDATGSLANASQGNYIVYMLAAFFGTLLVITIAKKIDKCKFLEYIGRNTLVIYAFQKLVALKASYIVYDYIITKVKVLENIYIKTIFCTIFAGLVLYVVVECINRHFPYVIGKKKEKQLEAK